MRDDQDIEELKGLRRWWLDVRRRWDEELQTNGFLRHLVHEPTFLVAVIGLLVCAGGVAVIIPKLWNPAPPHFSRTVRVSLLDLAQAWNLRRTALNSVAEGQWEDALVAWRSAMANNLADAKTHRGALETLRDAPWVHSANLNLALFSGEVLIELSGTNRADTLLVADVLIRHRLADVSLGVLRGWEKEFTPAEEAVWLRGLLTAGQVGAFDARWKASARVHEGDARMRLYRAAIDASGPPAQAVDGLDRLRTSLTDPALKIDAARLLCWAALRRDDPVEYERALSVLRESKSTMVQDEVGFWLLLARHDRLEDARRMAREYRELPPPTPMEAVQLARAWSELGLGDLAVDMFRDHGDRYGVAIDVWATYFDLLIDRRQWDDLRRVAATLRGNSSSKDDVQAMTWYAEAIADLSENRRTAVGTYLRRLEDSVISDSALVLRLASGLIRAGEFATSAKLLARVESDLGTQPDFWIQLLINAQGRRDTQTMQRATERLLELQPGSLVGLNVKLGLMLLAREKPAEALTLSVRLTSGGKASAGAAINHAAALLQNSRIAEAGEMLSRIGPSRLSAVERAAWELAQVEFLGLSGRPVEALELGGKIDVRQLMPPDESWLRKFTLDARRRVADTPP